MFGRDRGPDQPDHRRRQVDAEKLRLRRVG
jgi:hypothetical protein